MSMTDVELDALICRALKANLRAEFPGVFNPAAQFPWPQTSPRYQRWERRLLADPAGFVRRQCRPVWQKALRMAACLILCAALALVAVMAASPTARAWVVDRVVTWMETYTQFRFYGQNAQGVTADWRPAYVPEGFEETDVYWEENVSSLELTYENGNGGVIVLTAVPAAQSNSFNVDNEHSTYQEIRLNEQSAHLFSSNTDGYPSYLIWIDEGRSTAFQISSNIDVEEILKIAENVLKK